MDQLEISEQDTDGARILELRGELDLATSPLLGDALDRSIEDFDGDVLVDLTAVTFMDSMGLQVLLGALRRLSRHDRRLELVCPPGPILRLLAVTNLETAFTVHADRSAALASLRA
jgi:anti-sigma B factor antagonist